MATSKQANSIMVELPSIDIKTITVTIKGVTPLVTCPMSVKAMRQIEEKQQSVAKTKKHDIRNPWQDMIAALYWLTPPPNEYTEEAFNEAAKNAEFGFHVGGLKQSAVSGAYRRKLVKNMPEARGMFRVVSQGTDALYGKECVKIITDKPPIMRTDCLSTFNSGADMRYRPQFNNWSMQFDVQYDSGASVSIEQILTWFRLGGFGVGLGENRAEKGDGWGSYEVV